jgi:O-antigen/teichoic acid export membrane protein
MIRFLKNLWSNTFVKGGVFLTASNFLVGLLNYLFNILTARLLGPEGFGEISAFYSYLIILSTPVVILATYVILKIGEKKDQYSYTRSVQAWIIQKLKRWWYLIIPALIIIPFLPQLTNLSPIVAYSIFPILTISYLLAFYDGAMQGLQLLTYFALLSVILAFVKFLGPLISFYTVPDINIIILFIFLSLLTKMIVSHIILSKKFTGHKSKILNLNKRIIEVFKDKKIWLTAITSMSIGLLSNIDIIYVKQMFSAEDTGIYSSWSLFAKIILYALGPLLGLSFVYFSNKKQEINHQIFFIASFIFLMIVGVGMLFAYGLYSRKIIDMFFGSKFYPVIPYLEWAAFFGTAYVMILFMNNYFLAKKSSKAFILAGSLPFYCAALFIWGKDIGQVMLVNIFFSFTVLTIYLLLYFKSRFSSLWE